MDFESRCVDSLGWCCRSGNIYSTHTSGIFPMVVYSSDQINPREFFQECPQ
jgi:hypothetical protein